MEIVGVIEQRSEAMAVGESAARWLRVSTGGQDEANQEPDIDNWCRNHGYPVRRTYTLRGKSASKGQQDSMLDEMIDDMLRGVFSVLVVWASDRIERRGAYNAFDLARRVKEAGGRIEYVKDAYLNEVNDMSDVMLALAATRDKIESKRKTERTVMVQSRIRAAGAFVGKPPFGYRVDGEKYARLLVPSEAGRRLVPEMFQRCIDGQSLATIGAWLEEETGFTWYPRRVSGTLKNPVYRGVQEADDGRPVHKCAALVDAATWKRANEALSAHPKRGPQNGENRALLTEILVCGDENCDATGTDLEHGVYSPMYRHTSSDRNLRRQWYRCCGFSKGSQRKGCGNMIPLVTLDGIVDRLIRMNDTIRRELRTTPGADHAGELEEIKFEIRSLATQDLSDDEYDARLKELRAERDRIAALPVVLDRLEWVDSGETWGQLWKRLSPAERGPWLHDRGYKIRATRARTVVLDKTGFEIMEWVSQDGQIVLDVPAPSASPASRARRVTSSVGARRSARSSSSPSRS